MKTFQKQCFSRIMRIIQQFDLFLFVLIFALQMAFSLFFLERVAVRGKHGEAPKRGDELVLLSQQRWHS